MEILAMAIPKEVQAKRELNQKIIPLKKQLAETDYKAIKYAEGLISDADYAPIKAQRQAVRDQINALEQGRPIT